MDSRTVFVVGCMVVLYLCAWVYSLCNLLEIHFWDPVYALNEIRNIPRNEALYKSTAFNTKLQSYYSEKRYIFFLPHVVGAILWWNLYFFQLVKYIRRKFPAFHRYLGRSLMIAAICQTISGFGLACTSNSSIIKLVSFAIAGASLYCIVNAWYYARKKDFVRHKHWAKRLVGYMQTIAAQRFWLVFLITIHQSGWHFLYPSLDGKDLDEINGVVHQIFDDSFVLAILSSILITEWYLAYQAGMLDQAETIQKPTIVSGTPQEKTPLYSAIL